MFFLFSIVKMFYSKEINRLINKGMSFTTEKNWSSQNLSGSKFFGKSFWTITLALKSKNAQGMFGETFILVLLSFSCLSFTKSCLKFLLNCFAWKIKGFY